MKKLNVLNLFEKKRFSIRKLLYHIFFFIFLICISLFNCAKENTTEPKVEYNPGKNYYTTKIDGDTREYYVHVPSIYNSNKPTPVVFMLHGTTGNGERFYNISGWKELGEIENIITVYPSSWEHNVIIDGVQKRTTKWHIYPGDFEYCAGEIPRDDIKFLKQIIVELKQRFNVDSKRIYMAGFSNGGGMAGRCAIEMSDIFAAIVEASGVLPKDTTFVPLRKLPVMFQIGNSDDYWLEDASISIPMASFDSLLTSHPVLQGIVYTHTTTFGLSSTYTLTGDTNSVLTATFSATPPNPTQIFKFVVIKDLDHQYPNGINHVLNGAEMHWNWMKGFRLP
ncbi:prolyl oligopeptidase family serine peptidase [candidate division KSB1 bacterium]|nr:prolyl oligopeptidase family serine peptidase [candidate division KSB1 bacterium]